MLAAILCRRLTAQPGSASNTTGAQILIGTGIFPYIRVQGLWSRQYRRNGERLPPRQDLAWLRLIQTPDNNRHTAVPTWFIRAHPWLSGWH
ncbi:MAG: hypothetical protein N2512_12510 [Armatimonadetes bacterium]|nr:hypothetical protein [Armatimonadota bacterium]